MQVIQKPVMRMTKNSCERIKAAVSARICLLESGAINVHVMYMRDGVRRGAYVVNGSGEPVSYDSDLGALRAIRRFNGTCPVSIRFGKPDQMYLKHISDSEQVDTVGRVI